MIQLVVSGVSSLFSTSRHPHRCSAHIYDGPPDPFDQSLHMNHSNYASGGIESSTGIFGPGGEGGGRLFLYSATRSAFIHSIVTQAGDGRSWWNIYTIPLSGSILISPEVGQRRGYINRPYRPNLSCDVGPPKWSSGSAAWGQTSNADTIQAPVGQRLLYWRVFMWSRKSRNCASVPLAVAWLFPVEGLQWVVPTGLVPLEVIRGTARTFQDTGCVT